MQSCWAQETFVKNWIKPKCKHHSLTEHLMVCAKGGLHAFSMPKSKQQSKMKWKCTWRCKKTKYFLCHNVHPLLHIVSEQIQFESNAL